tara:strand:+ start:2617 stop:3633 length:1017 start_codon:yes stop_codon:yes gene_type:complete
MHRLLVWISRAPFWAYFLVAAALGWFGNEQRVVQGPYATTGIFSLAEAVPPRVAPAGRIAVQGTPTLVVAANKAPMPPGWNFLPAAGFALLGLLRLLLGRFRRPQGATHAEPEPVAIASAMDAATTAELADGSPDFIRAISQRHLQRAEQTKKGSAQKSATDASLDRVMRKQKSPKTKSFRMSFVLVPGLLISAVLAYFPGQKGGVIGGKVQVFADAVVGYSEDLLPPRVFGIGEEVMAKLAEVQKFAAERLLDVPFLQSPGFLAIKNNATRTLISLDRAAWNATGLPLILLAALLALGLLGLRVLLKHREQQIFAVGREDPFERLLKRRRTGTAART